MREVHWVVVATALGAALVLRKRRRARQLLGFVDLQVNGYLGTCFSDGDLSRGACYRALHALLERGGTIAIMPTIITSPLGDYEHTLPLLADAVEDPQFCGRLLGIHLEGPFLSPAPGACGAHRPEHMISPAHGITLLGAKPRARPAANPAAGPTRCSPPMTFPVILPPVVPTQSDGKSLRVGTSGSLQSLRSGVVRPSSARTPWPWVSLFRSATSWPPRTT